MTTATERPVGKGQLAPLLPGGAPIESLLRKAQFFTPGTPSEDHRELHRKGGRQAEQFYKDRWKHDKEVRSTHGVNCTGSCSWKVYVKDGIITWETQQTDYPSVGPDSPEYEPRGCPRGASFSWYTYSPARVRFPYIRGPLLKIWREVKKRVNDPVLTWQEIINDPQLSAEYKKYRGKGGFVRSTWKEVSEIIAAAHVQTTKQFGPDRIVGFSPIPAMSMVSYATGTRFLSLIGGTILSFYDWYADMPIASPQAFGDQTDVPESADWWNSSYMILWGSNLPVTRTPDAHFMTEARYKGTKVVVVSPDFGDHTKFADDWLPANPGTDGALAMGMGHVILTEFYRDRQVGYFTDYVKKYTDLPFLVTLRERDSGGTPGNEGVAAGGAYVPDRFLTAADLGRDQEAAAHQTVLMDEATGEPVFPNGTLASRFSESGKGKWNLDLQGVDPALTMLGRGGEAVSVDLPRFDIGETEGGSSIRRGVPTMRVGGHLVTTAFDLLMAQYAVKRDGLPGEWPEGYDDPHPYTPAWQEPITGVPAPAVARIAREFARNAELTRGRSMIMMGAGTNHWYHSDQIYRTFFTMLLLCGTQGVNGGGWAHYVGQEKVRPLTGFQQVAFALDWQRPTRHMAGASFFYTHTDQWRYESFGPDELASPLGEGRFKNKAFIDTLAEASRMGWTPSHPSLTKNPLDVADDAAAAGKPIGDHVIDEMRAGRLGWAAEDPDAPENFPRVLTIWRANLLGSSGKGMEYFMRHLIGADDAVRAEESPAELRPTVVKWHDEAPRAKLDLITTVDFRMTSTCTYSDIVLPAATWYEKHDLSSTDMHPFVHSFNPAIAPPWETRTDFDTFMTIADDFARMAEGHLDTRTDILSVPLMHDTPGELAQPGGRALDWAKGECDPIPGTTMPGLVAIERDYRLIGEKMRALGPLVENVGTPQKGISWKPTKAVDLLGRVNGTIRGGVGDGRPKLERDVHMCEAILALSGTTNAQVAIQGWQAYEERTGQKLADLAEERAADRISFEDTQVQPRAVITSPEWSGSEADGRRYSPFVVNVERLKPWHTLTGRMHFFVDHDWMIEYGEQLPTYRPPLNYLKHFGDQQDPNSNHPQITVRYLTPHSKWSIHSEYQDNLHMLRLFRGGPTIWISDVDAKTIGVTDNEWVEVFNRNGVVVCRVTVSHRMPKGTVYYHHAKDRHLMTPKSEISGWHGGGDNSLTRATIKPTHMIGGYGQFTYGFNYYGPTGNQRDEITVIRKRSQEVEYS